MQACFMGTASLGGVQQLAGVANYYHNIPVPMLVIYDRLVIDDMFMMFGT